MLGATYLTYILLVLVSKICMISGDRCTSVIGTSGTITNEIDSSFYSKCWRVRVPPNSITRINMESFDGEICELTRVEVYSVNEDEKYVLCPHQSWKLVFNSDFIVQHITSSEHHKTYSKFSMEYQSENTLCSQEDVFKCNDATCIPRSEVCDETEQCPNGTDEEDCDSTVLLERVTKETRKIGIQWLRKKWSYTSGWQENTHRGVTALFLAIERNAKNMEEKLMVKQLEVQALVYLLRKETDPLTVNQLSMFVNALSVSCQNPYNFYGYDLVKLLKDKAEVSSLTARPGAYLALCNAGEALPVNATNDLINLLKTDLGYSFLLDVQALAVLALSCLQSSNQKDLYSLFPHTDYKEALRKFKQFQLEDGSMGNIYTTAIVTQALLSAGEQNSKDWNYNKTIHYLNHQLKSSVDFLSVYLILPILNGKYLSHIGSTNCSTFMQRDPVSDVKSHLGPKMRVQFFLYIGDEKDIVHTISLRVPENTTAFEV